MRHIFRLTHPPERSGKSSIPDGAICGNGDLAVILGRAPDGVRIYLSKCDIWEGIERYDAGGIKPLGFIDIPVSDALYEQYCVEQDMDLGELRCRFGGKTGALTFTLTVHKTENSLCIRSTGDLPLQAVLCVFAGDTTGRKGTFAQDGVEGIFRSFDGGDCAYETHAFAAMRETAHGVYYLFAATNHDVPDPQSTVVKAVTAADEAKLAALYTAHRDAWKAFWSKSAFEVSDRALENGWYAGQYFLAVCAGNRRFPPGLFANFITVEHPAWHSDYHLNYNYQAPFYAACASNHAELTECYMTPLEEFAEKGASFAQRFGCRGVLYPVGIAPKGLCSELDHSSPYAFERLFLGQKNNQVHPADIAIMRYRATLDTDFAREHLYPYLKACLLFFEDYGKWEDGKFNICCDAAHEVPIYRDDFTPEKYKKVLHDKNNVVTLGMLRMALDCAIDIAQTLGVDEEQVAVWEHIRAHLPEFPTCIRFGRRVFRYTESGQRWNETGDVGLQHVYPAGCVGLSSPPELLKTARTTFRMKRDCFTDDNAVSSYYPMAARLGISPQLIVRKLRMLQSRYRLPNGLYRFAGGCLENCPIVANTLNEMALQSHQNVVRLFPCWDASLDCAFRDLRADGAFLVSSSMHKGVVGTTRITAEKGGKLCMILPFSHAKVQCGGTAITVTDGRFTLQTKPGDTITVEPVKE